MGVLGAIRFNAKAQCCWNLLADRFLYKQNEAMNCIIASFVYGAADRTRTGTELPPADFKSAVSTIPPQRHIPEYINTESQNRQVGNGLCAVPQVFNSAVHSEMFRIFPGTRPGCRHYIMYGRTFPGTRILIFGH